MSSCITKTPLVIHNPYIANTSTITEKYDYAGSFTINAANSTFGEEQLRNNTFQLEGKFAVNNFLFIEGLFLNQREISTLESIRNLGRNIDTFNSEKTYLNKALNFGIGYYKKIGEKKRTIFSVGLGWQKHDFNVNGTDIENNSITTTAKINFSQQGLYINPSLHITWPQIIYTIGFQQNFVKYNNINYVGNNRDIDNIATLKSLKGTQKPFQFYQKFAVSPIDIPIVFKFTSSINIIQLPINLHFRAMTFGIGVGYYSFNKKSKKTKTNAT